MFEISLSDNEINKEIEEREEHLLRAYNEGLISQCDYWLGIIEINEKLLHRRRKYKTYDISNRRLPFASANLCPCHLL
jgi:hypothetical protein